MSNASAHVMAAVYESDEQAKMVLDMLKSMHRNDTITLIDAAIVAKDAEGKVRIKETSELTGRKGARRGAIVTGIVGLIFPPSFIASALAGGGIGALIQNALTAFDAPLLEQPLSTAILSPSRRDVTPFLPIQRGHGPSSRVLASGNHPDAGDGRMPRGLATISGLREALQMYQLAERFAGLGWFGAGAEGGLVGVAEGDRGA